MHYPLYYRDWWENYLFMQVQFSLLNPALLILGLQPFLSLHE